MRSTLQMKYLKAIEPNQFIRKTQQLKPFYCFYCEEFKVQMLRCKGPCQSNLCLDCYKSQFYSMQGRCHKKCSTHPNQFAFLTEIPTEFICPYNAQKCKIILHSVQQFKKHCQQCPYVPPKRKQQLQYQQQFKCVKGHSLTYLTPMLWLQLQASFMNKKYEGPHMICQLCRSMQRMSSTCYQCNQKDISDFKVYYCYGCRTPPCTRQQCPVGHIFKVEVADSVVNDCFCQICGVPSLEKGLKQYYDQLCQIRLCQKCHQQLPMINSQLPLKHQPQLKYGHFKYPILSEYANMQEYDSALNNLVSQILQQFQKQSKC